MVETSNAIIIDTTIRAAVEKLWQAWTDPVIIKKWFGSDPGGEGLAAELDVRPGGYFEVTFRDADLIQHTCSGFYDEVQELRKLSFSWNWKTEPGVASFVTVSFAPQGTVTIMRLEHANTGTASRHNYIKGWESTFLKLDHLLSSKINNGGLEA